MIDESKVRDYLLSPSHPVGRFKAAFFAAFGFTHDAWLELSRGLARLAAEGEAMKTETTAFGQKYEVRGNLTSPSGRSVSVVTVWIVRVGETVPRFVTAFPTSKP